MAIVIDTENNGTASTHDTTKPQMPLLYFFPLT
jgi:hypothetical protein